MPASWRFSRLSPDELRVDPVQAEFFNTEALQDVSEALIREFIQNSLDAALPNKKVTVRMHVPSDGDRVPSNRGAYYLASLQPHLRAPRNGLDSVPPPSAGIPFLSLEDFGTTGLQGDPGQHGDVRDGRNHFYYFWRNVGRSAKSDSELGRWGLGKSVFPASSLINTFWGLTVRAQAPQELLMGQCILKIHSVNDTECRPYGYWGEFERDGFAMPVTDSEIIHTFKTDFQLSRIDEPGLSVVIPFPADGITPETVLKAVIRQYFFAIVSDALRVVVRCPTEEIVVDSETIFRTVARMNQPFRDEVDELIRLASWAWNVPEDYLAILKSHPQYDSPKWRPDLFEEELVKRVL